MRRSLLILIMISVLAMLSGCIISTTPKENPVVLLPGKAKTFSIRVFPASAEYAWYVEGTLVPGAEGNTLTYMINELLPSSFTIEVRATSLSGTDKYTWNIHYVGKNKPPFAEAGADQSTIVGATAILDGSGSTDPDNNIVTYHWRQTGGPMVTLSDYSAVKPQFVANVPLGSSLRFELTVTDTGGLSDSDTCVVTVDANIMWNRTFGGSKEDWARAVQQTSDGGYIIAGQTNSYGAGEWDFWVMKTDAQGNKLWVKTFGNERNEIAWSVQQTSDGGYIIAGYTYVNDMNSDIWVMKTDANGIEQWNKIFGGNGNDRAYAVQQTSDGGYVIAGWTSSYGAGSADAWLIKTDADGNMLWDKTFGGTAWEDAYSVHQTSDGGYIVAGFTYSFSAGSSDAWLIKTDADGNMLWDKTFGGIGLDVAYALQLTSDGGYILTGDTNSYGAGSSDFWLIKTDADGNMLWDKTFGGAKDDEAYAVQQTSDGGYILTGFTYSHGAGSSDFWLIKTDADGNMLWTKTFGSEGLDWAWAVQQTSDGGYILAGYTTSYGAGSFDVWLIKTDAEGNAPRIPIPG